MSVTKPTVLSFGGGVQSSALVALLGLGVYPGSPPTEVWFCDPQNEKPDTYVWIDTIIKPYLAALNVPFLTLKKVSKLYPDESLLDSYRRREQYPLRTNRQCTIDWKIKVMEAECKRRGWHKSGGVEKHIGISLDELHRAKPSFDESWEVKRYPLIEARLFRDECVALCDKAFGAVPVKSGCWFCKFARPAGWKEVWEDRADGRWDLAVEWEQEVMERYGLAGVFIDSKPNKPLPEWAVMWEQGAQLPMFTGPSTCDGGYCFT